jgi:hypothetical protein
MNNMEMVNIIHKLKSLPLQTKKILGLGVVVGMFIALPLFVWAVVTQQLFFSKKAVSGEPGTVTGEPISPICLQSSIPPATGVAPLSVTLFGAGSAGSGAGLEGYQWDFEDDGIWDTSVSINPPIHIYTQPGIYYPVYKILNTNDVWSSVCNYPYAIVVGNPNPTPSSAPSPSPSVCNASCTSNNDCGSGQICFDNSCRNPSCINNASCVCSQATPSPSPSPLPISGDVNSDGHVNIVDVGIIVDNYGSSPPSDTRADLNNDNIINIVDIGIVVDHYEF